MDKIDNIVSNAADFVGVLAKAVAYKTGSAVVDSAKDTGREYAAALRTNLKTGLSKIIKYSNSVFGPGFGKQIGDSQMIRDRINAKRRIAYQRRKEKELSMNIPGHDPLPKRGRPKKHKKRPPPKQRLPNKRRR